MRMIVKIGSLLALVALSASVAYAGPLAGTGVVNSPHDMIEKFPGNPDVMGRVCVYCHTPHNATQDDSFLYNYPLWNHELVASTGWLSYVWAAPANATISTEVTDTVDMTLDPLAGPSRLCMSCHDGVTAADQHNGAMPMAGANPISGKKAIGLNNGDPATASDLTDDHPIGFSWTEADAARNAGTKPEIALVTDTFASGRTDSAVGGTMDTTIRFPAGNRTIGDVLYDGDIMTCASCHDVHNKDNVPPSVNTSGGPVNYFLWADQNDSLICLSCHYK